MSYSWFKATTMFRIHNRSMAIHDLSYFSEAKV